MSLGRFWKCGYYDWRVVSFHAKGKVLPVNKVKPQESEIDPEDFEEEEYGEEGVIAQGRFVVHPRDLRQQQLHEVFVDH